MIPETKKQVRQVMGLFSYFREYIPSFAEIAKPITDLTAKQVPTRVPWGQEQQLAFQKLKDLLCQATEEPLQIIDPNRPFSLFVDSSDYAIGCVLIQQGVDGKEKPVAFYSQKLTPTQRAWAVIEREAYAAITGLRKYRQLIFGAPVTLFSDHNPLTYIAESSAKSPKLMRWALALQEYCVTFKYLPEKRNEAADCLSRPSADDRFIVND